MFIYACLVFFIFFFIYLFIYLFFYVYKLVGLLVLCSSFMLCFFVLCF